MKRSNVIAAHQYHHQDSPTYHEVNFVGRYPIYKKTRRIIIGKNNFVLDNQNDRDELNSLNAFVTLKTSLHVSGISALQNPRMETT